MGRWPFAARRPLGAEVFAVRDVGHAASVVAQRQGRVDLVLVDCPPESASGELSSVLSRLSRGCSGIPIVGLLDDGATITTVVAAVRGGVRDFVWAPVQDEELNAVADRLVPVRRSIAPGAEAKQVMVREIIAFLSRHPTDTISLEKLAAMSGLTGTNLGRIFREVTGRPIRAFVIELRLALARELLETSALTVTDIAQEAGFYDLAHLDHTFRKHYGLAPSAARARSRSRAPAGAQGRRTRHGRYPRPTLAARRQPPPPGERRTDPTAVHERWR
jgi:AraC-like DNA-binding protein